LESLFYWIDCCWCSIIWLVSSMENTAVFHVAGTNLSLIRAINRGTAQSPFSQGNNTVPIGLHIGHFRPTALQSNTNQMNGITLTHSNN
jgi:hypothetical protein